MWQYCLNFNCFNTTDNLSASFNMRGCVKYMASGALFVGSQIKEAWKDSGMENTDLTISTIDNNLTVQTTGLTNKQLNWGGVLNIVEFIK